MKNNFPRLGPIIIGTKDLKVSKDFYIKVFGLEVNSENTNYISGHLIDGTHIELEEDSENRFNNWAEHNIGTYKSSEFYVADIKSFLDKVASNGGSVVSLPTKRPWGSLTAEFADPDGNIFLISEK
jgi:predicted enzyme related to lactoylglutathione lyase